MARKSGVSTLRLPFNTGVGGAVRTGLRFAEQQRIRTCRGRRCRRPARSASVSPALLERLDAGADLVIGSRFADPDERLPRRRARRSAMHLLAAVVHRITGQRFTDVTSGYRAFSSAAIQLLAASSPSSTWPTPSRCCSSRTGPGSRSTRWPSRCAARGRRAVEPERPPRGELPPPARRDRLRELPSPTHRPNGAHMSTRAHVVVILMTAAIVGVVFVPGQQAPAPQQVRPVVARNRRAAAAVRGLPVAADGAVPRASASSTRRRRSCSSGSASCSVSSSTTRGSCRASKPPPRARRRDRAPALRGRVRRRDRDHLGLTLGSPESATRHARAAHHRSAVSLAADVRSVESTLGVPARLWICSGRTGRRRALAHR